MESEDYSFINLMPNLIKSGVVPCLYNSIKKAEYENIINTGLNSVSSVDNPVFLQIAGIPGSGKTTIIKELNLSNYLIIGFDMIMDKLESYKSDVKNYGLETAFKNNEIPARIVGYEMLARAAKNKLNIVLEHSGMLESHFDLIRNLNSLGYKTKMRFIKCPIELAIKRAKSRESEIKRYTPESIIIERHNKIDDFLKQYENLFQELEIIETCDYLS